MGDVQWIRLATDVFNNRKVKRLRSLPSGDSLVLIWFQLLCLAGNVNADGIVYFTKDIPYTDEMLAQEFEHPITTIQLALKIFHDFGMIDVVDNFIYVSSWEKYQNIDGLTKIREQNKLRQQNYRERKRVLITQNDIETLQSNVTVTSPMTLCNGTDKNRTEEEKKRTEEDKEIRGKKKKEKTSLAIAQIEQTYFPNDDYLNKTFMDFIKMRKSLKNGAMTERAIQMMINKLNKYDNDIAIAMLEQSITNNWKDVYEIKNKPQYKLGQQSSNIDWNGLINKYD